MFKIFKNEKSYNNGDIIRPWVINQYNKLSLAKFSHKEILSVLDMNITEIEYIKKQNFIIVNEETVKENKETIKKESVKENVDKTKEVKENKETIKKESVKENADKEVKENKKVANTVKEESVEEDPLKWTDEKIIEKAVELLTKNMEYQDKEQMSNLLKESFNTDKGLIDLYRNKFLSEYKTTKNTKKEDEKEIKSEVIENKEEKGKKVKSEDNKTDDLNIDNETLEMLVDDVYDQYSALFNIKKDSLRNLIISVLKEKPEVLKSNNYYFVCMRLCEIIESLIMENTIEDNEEDDEILKQLNSIVE